MLMFLFKFNVYRPSGTSLSKAVFLIDCRELIFAAFYFAWERHRDSVGCAECDDVPCN